MDFTIRYKNNLLNVEVAIDDREVMWGSDADGNRGELRRDIDIDIISIKDQQEAPFLNYDADDIKDIIEEEYLKV